MSPFSSLLPDSKKEEKLKPGTVIYCYCPATKPPKHKYQLIYSVEPLLVLLINSKINEFILKKPYLLSCQVTLKSADYEFLDKDSHLNCVEAHECYDISDMRGKIVANYSTMYMGEILPNSARDVIAAVNESVVMAPIHKRIITTHLNNFLNGY